jgi:hypothetical protein
MSDQTELVQQAASLLKSGKKEEARQILVQFVRQEPNHVFAWYVLSFCVDDISQKRSCLQRALAIDPKSAPVRQALDKLNNATPPVSSAASVELRPTPPPVPPTSPAAVVAPVQTGAASPKTGEVAPPPPQPISASVSPAQQPAAAPVPPGDTSSVKAPPPARQAPVLKKAPPTPTPAAKGIDNNLLIYGGIILGAFIIGLGVFPFLIKSNGITFGVLLILAAIMYVIYQIYIQQQTATRKRKQSHVRNTSHQTEQSFADLIADPGEGFKLIRNVVASNGTISYLILSDTGGVFPIDAPLYVGKIEFKHEQLLVNGLPPERDFIEISLQNAFWLRDKLEPVIGTKPWITPILVFPNASVSGVPPLKGVHVLSQKNLFTTLQAEAAKRSNSLIWEKSEEIRKILNAD